METAFKALSRAGLWEMAPTVVRRALLEEAAEEGRRAAELMEAPDVGELIRAQLVFHLVDREAKDGEVDVPFLAPRPGCITRAFESLGCRENYRRGGTSMYWAWPRDLYPPSGGHEDREGHQVNVYTTQSAFFLGATTSPEVFAALEGFHAHVVLEVRRPTPEMVGAMLADVTDALLTHGATSYRHVLRLSPVCCVASYKLSESVAPCIDYLLPFLRKYATFETTPSPLSGASPEDHYAVFVPIRIEDEWIELVDCQGGPEGARLVLHHVDQKWVRISRTHTPAKDRWSEMIKTLYAENRWKTQQPNLN
jgi:hypothetical protein